MEFEVERMEPLFATKQITRNLRTSRKTSGASKDLSTYKGKCFLGIDAGSTTTKAALVGEDGTFFIPSIITTTEARLVQRFLQFKDIYSKLPEGVKLSFLLYRIRRSTDQSCSHA